MGDVPRRVDGSRVARFLSSSSRAEFAIDFSCESLFQISGTVEFVERSAVLSNKRETKRIQEIRGCASHGNRAAFHEYSINVNFMDVRRTEDSIFLCTRVEP